MNSDFISLINMCFSPLRVLKVKRGRQDKKETEDQR